MKNAVNILYCLCRKGIDCRVGRGDKLIVKVLYCMGVQGPKPLRGGVFKPRTSPYSFQGLGQAGIPLLVDAGQEAGLPVVTEITDPRQLDDLADVDVLQVGARNMQTFPLLQALGQVRKPVLLKRGMSATVTELLQAAENIWPGAIPRSFCVSGA